MLEGIILIYDYDYDYDYSACRERESPSPWPATAIAATPMFPPLLLQSCHFSTEYDMYIITNPACALRRVAAVSSSVSFPLLDSQ